MIIRLIVSFFFTGVGVCLARLLPLPAALLTWTALVALLCAGGAVLLARQPLGKSTPFGRVGGGVVRWGYGVGRGQLLPAIAISWLIWTTLGFSVISLTLTRAEPKTMLMVLIWTVDVLALYYVVGVILNQRSSPRQNLIRMVVVASLMVAVIGGSMMLWRSSNHDAVETLALVVGGGPFVLLAVGYGIVLAMGVAEGRRLNWH